LPLADRAARCVTAGARASSLAVLLVADLLHPVYRLAVQLLLDGDVRHRRGRRRPVPVLLARRKPDHVTGPDFLDWPAPALRPTAAGRHDQGLAERVRVPRGSGTRLKGDAGTSDTPRDRKSTRLNSSHSQISYAVFCL